MLEMNQNKAKSELNSQGSFGNTRHRVVVPLRSSKPPLPYPGATPSAHPSTKKVMFKLDEDNQIMRSHRSRSSPDHSLRRSRSSRGPSSGNSSPDSSSFKNNNHSHQASSFDKYSSSYQRRHKEQKIGEDSDLEALRALRTHYR